VFRLLVKHEPDGPRGRRHRQGAGGAAKHHVLASFDPVPRGLVSAQRFSRSIVYRADLDPLSGRHAVHAEGLLRWTAGNMRAADRKPHALLSAVQEKAALMQSFDLPRRLVAEALGTALLVATVVGSGIMAESLTRDVALALLGKHASYRRDPGGSDRHSRPISGAHFNPAVTLIFALKRELTPRDALFYILAQIAGGIAGTMMAHAMFALPLLDASLKMRSGGAQWFAEAWLRSDWSQPFLQASASSALPCPGWSAFTSRAAYWFTSSTSFANPAVAIAAIDDQHFFRNSARGPSRLYRRRALRRRCRADVDEVAAACGRRGGPNDEGGSIMSVTIYHNPACGTSRNTLAMIRQSGEEPEVIEYLKHPPSRGAAGRTVGKMGISVRALLREKGTPYAELGLADPKWSDEELIDFMLAHPILINRPIVVTPKGVRLAGRRKRCWICSTIRAGFVRERGRRSRHAGEIIDSLFSSWPA